MVLRNVQTRDPSRHSPVHHILTTQGWYRHILRSYVEDYPFMLRYYVEVISRGSPRRQRWCWSNPNRRHMSSEQSEKHQRRDKDDGVFSHIMSKMGRLGGIDGCRHEIRTRWTTPSSIFIPHPCVIDIVPDTVIDVGLITRWGGSNKWQGRGEDIIRGDPCLHCERHRDLQRGTYINRKDDMTRPFSAIKPLILVHFIMSVYIPKWIMV